MDMFSALDRDGDEVVLRSPSVEDLTCLALREQEITGDMLPVGTGADTGDSQVAAVIGSTVSALWMLRSRDCATDCHCQLIELSVALEGLGVEDRMRALEAHMRLMGSINDHLSAANDVALGINKLGSVCAHCILEPDAHGKVLELELVERSRELAEALSLYALELRSLRPR